MTNRVALLGLLAILLGLAGCHPLRTLRSIGGTCHDSRPYMSAHNVPPLKVPPGLASPDTTSALKIPTLNEPPPPPRKGRDACLDEPPAFRATKQPPPQA